MFSKFFVEHPVFAFVVAIIIVLVGAISYLNLPVAQYPTIAPVQVNVTTTYPGADAETVAQSVAAPIEAQINGVERMLYMSSTNSDTGQMTISVYFDETMDPDIAQVLVQNRVNLAEPQLPKPVLDFGVTVQQQSSSVMMIIPIYSPDGRYPLTYVANYANLYVLSAVQRVPGAGQAAIFGNFNQAMRIWMNPDQMTSLGFTTSDVQRAVANQNQVTGAGLLGQPPNARPLPLAFPVTGQQQFTNPSQYDEIILRASQDGSAIVRLKDVARTEVGFEQYVSINEFSGKPAVFIVVYQQPGANAIDVSNRVHKTLETMKSSFPAGLEYRISLDTTDFVRTSLKEVKKTLFIAILLVIAVMYLFLQSFRATIVATAAIVVAITGTFAGMLALGFSLNLLTLFGLVLAIGLVVDDAIVVIENAERNMAIGKTTPKEAVIRAMGEVTGPVIATVLVLVSVFVPAAFISGPTGQLYRQFAITIAVSVTISGFVALTLTPMLSAMLLRHREPPSRGFFAWFNRAFERMTKGYGGAVSMILRRTVLGVVIFVAMLVGTWKLFTSLPTSFVPQEDQGYVLAAIIMPDAASLERTHEMVRKIDALFAENPAVQDRLAITGYDIIDSQYLFTQATVFVTLKPYGQRQSPQLSADAVLADVSRKAFEIKDGFTIAIPPPAIPGIGTQAGFNFWVQSLGAGSPAQLGAVVDDLLAKARRRPELAKVNSTFHPSSQTMHIDVDREKAVLLGVPVKNVYDTLQMQLGSLFISQFTQFSRVWNVVAQADARFRETPDDITRLYVSGDTGQQVPLSGLVKLTYGPAPTLLSHFNGFPAAQVTGVAAPGFSSGQAIAAIEEVAHEVLPQDYGFGWSGLAYSQIQAGNSSAIVFAFGLLLVFLILAAQYESWALPAAVITAVPFGVLGALVATVLRGLDDDVYFQIGLLTLIGLASKNAILIVEFAVEKRKEGLSVIDAAVQAGAIRLRPIIMTSLAFIFGTLPLVVATGAGANARHSIGTGITGGMIGASTLALLFVPLFFSLFERLKERKEAAGGARVPTPSPPPAVADAR